ncbi:Qat anti-phage system associated protein QatB [Xanthobacter agilis]|uniref:Qat anti-phage system associated protein QatB n=1 Tax=Xanthobacter agilis TaxID=47492 RepID=UPI00372B10FF
MGTSTPFGGPKNGNPLIPTWLEPSLPPAAPAPPPDPDDSSPDGVIPAGGEESPSAQPDGNPKEPDVVYVRPARRLMNQRLRAGSGDDGGGERIGRALSSWVRQGAGGASTAAKRSLASSGGAVGRLSDVLFDAASGSIRETIWKFDLGSLAQRSLQEIYVSLVDIICGDGGDLDESMNRDAYVTAVDELMAIDGIDLEKPSVDTINLLIERFIVGTIDNRVKNAITNGIVLLPDSVEEARIAEQDVRGFVVGAVRSAMTAVGRILSPARIRSALDEIYDRAMSVLATYGDEIEGEAG